MLIKESMDCEKPIKNVVSWVYSIKFGIGNLNVLLTQVYDVPTQVSKNKIMILIMNGSD